MEIERYMKALMLDESMAEEAFAEGTEINPGLPFLEMAGQGETLDIFDYDVHDSPAFVSLKVSLKGQKLRDLIPNYTFEFASKKVSSGKVTVAALPGQGIHNCLSSIDLIWEGDGYQKSDQGDHQSLEDDMVKGLQKSLQDNLLYRKEFTLPPGKGFFCHEDSTGIGRWQYACPSWPKPRLNERPLIPFGGALSEDLDLDRTMALYAYIAGGKKTGVGLKSQTYWQNLGVYPGKRGADKDRHYSLVAMPKPIIQKTLGQTIRGGDIHFGSNEATYVSFDYQVVDPVQKTILLHFKQG